jgi:hypothetical protein
MQLDLPFLVQDIDRFGNVRLYVRKKVEGRYRKERLRSQPGSPLFHAEYQAPLSVLRPSATPLKPMEPSRGRSDGWSKNTRRTPTTSCASTPVRSATFF